VVVVHAGAALPVERLAVRVADGIDLALLAERLQVTVDGGQADLLALAPQLRVDLLGAAEAGQARQRGGQRLRLLGPAPARAARGTRGPCAQALVRLLRRHSRTVQRRPPSG
jgi:hypothetical protein